MKQTYVMKVYQKDKRYKTGERLVGTYTYEGRDQAGMERECRELNDVCPSPKFRMEFHPATKTVKNLMSGADVEIDYDTPRCCDPSSELYWTM